MLAEVGLVAGAVAQGLSARSHKLRGSVRYSRKRPRVVEATGVSSWHYTRGMEFEREKSYAQELLTLASILRDVILALSYQMLNVVAAER